MPDEDDVPELSPSPEPEPRPKQKSDDKKRRDRSRSRAKASKEREDKAADRRSGGKGGSVEAELGRASVYFPTSRASRSAF